MIFLLKLKGCSFPDVQRFCCYILIIEDVRILHGRKSLLLLTRLKVRVWPLARQSPPPPQSNDLGPLLLSDERNLSFIHDSGLKCINKSAQLSVLAFSISDNLHNYRHQKYSQSAIFSLKLFKNAAAKLSCCYQEASPWLCCTGSFVVAFKTRHELSPGPNWMEHFHSSALNCWTVWHPQLDFSLSWCFLNLCSSPQSPNDRHGAVPDSVYCAHFNKHLIYSVLNHMCLISL